jgi:dethiobiotin synthetase
MSGFFITGTDTEIGKTFVSSLLIKILVEDGLQVVGMKPIASGANIIDGSLKNEDALSLMRASNVDADYKNINPYIFEQAIAPHIAAEQVGIEIDLEEIKNNFDQLKNKSDVVVVEGVGGWYAPLSDSTTVADLAETLALPIILVVGLRLGCLNHALLTAQAIRQSGLPVAGWVANYVEKDFSSADTNITTLKNYLNDFSFLGTVSYQTNNKNNSQTHTINKQMLINRLSIKK